MLTNKKMDITPFHDQSTGTMTYVISCPVTKHSAIIDPVLDYNPYDGTISFESANTLIAFIKEQGLRLTHLLETHVHADHLSASCYLKRKLGGQIGISSRITEVQHTFTTLFNLSDCSSSGREFDLLFSDKQTFQVGELTVKTIATPGHTPACLCYQVQDNIFVGDTIFSPNLGTARCDFPGGSAKTLFASISKLLTFAEDTKLYVGHNYPTEGQSPDYVHTIKEQKESNPYLEQFDEKSFVAMRSLRDQALGPPKLLFPSLQVNIRGGQLPPPRRQRSAVSKDPPHWQLLATIKPLYSSSQFMVRSFDVVPAETGI